MNSGVRWVRALAALAMMAGLLLVLWEFLGPGAYPWVKGFHVIAVISWMAGLLYLPRLFVYHAGAAKGSELSETLKVMERRLLTYIMNPAMVVAWILGLWLAATAGFWVAPWFQAKFACVVALTGVHHYFMVGVRGFAEDRNQRSARHWRIMNEVPTILMIAIVLLVVV